MVRLILFVILNLSKSDGDLSTIEVSSSDDNGDDDNNVDDDVDFVDLSQSEQSSEKEANQPLTSKQNEQRKHSQYLFSPLMTINRFSVIEQHFFFI